MATVSKFPDIIKNYMNPYIHSTIKDGLYRLNIAATRKISLVFSIIEFFILLYYIFFNRIILSSKGVLPSTLLAIAVSITAFLICDHGLKSSNRPYKAYRFVCIAYFILLIVFGMFVSYFNYTRGHQIFTFFSTIVCLVNFILLPPALSSVVIGGSYIIFYLFLYSYDHALQVNLFNYSLFAMLTIIGSYNKYRMQATELERIHRIERMNDMLQNVPVHDNVTDMKNRYALRDDFNSYQNHHIIVVMLDLEDFKSINAEHGQKAGDLILKQVGECIKTHLTDSHSYRYGSDSFLIILQDIELSDALQRLSIWERNMATLSVPDIDQQIHYTSGYSHGTPRDEDELRMLIEAADRKRRDFS
ncbi:GGDEF domain-containing protein [Butyrivibrio sp. WCE2006]|uniref:GGDEF domain-containing protein n=1 Tax=Butyrivibrio sp. WCE2006 TaxID=1410611 RepID=UPI0005D180B8|nr:GGDEF domain-containing protein [Butyrivibrio sp. WCE2006]